MSRPEGFVSVAFAQPARAGANLELLRARLPEKLHSLVSTILPQVPDPDGALNNLERFTRDAGRRVFDACLRQPVLLHYLLALFSHSRFLSETLIQQPDLLVWLGREKHLERLAAKEELLEEYARFETTNLDVEPTLALARFKRRQYLRITLKDILGLSTLVETTLELSTLADVLLEKALARAEVELRQRYGTPETVDARGRRVPARFAVVSLGKLGGQELNYSSDIDLLFLFDGDGGTSAPESGRRLANSEFFIRLAQRLLQIIAGVSREGPVFRVDMRLRPGGGEGDLAISLPAALDYYQRQAREWELQMLVKARHSAGDASLVRAFLTEVEPFLYKGAVQFAVVDSVLKAREQFDRKLDAASDARLNVKLAPGGIRDIEFLVQCLQRLYGRDDPWVRAGGTLVGLQKLYEKGYLVARDHFRLAAAYQFLRRVEHRLQLDQGQQTHTVPEEPEARALLARRCGPSEGQPSSSAAQFSSLLEDHLRHVRVIYERTLPQARRAPEREDFALRAPEALGLAGELSFGELRARLEAQGAALARALGGLDVPERAQKALHRFLTAALASSASYERVSRAAAALPTALEVFRLSEPLSALLIRHPERLAQLLELCGPPRAESQLGIRFEGGAAAGVPPELRVLVEPSEPLAAQMAGLRSYFSDAVFRWGARELCRPAEVEDGLRAHTVLTEGVLQAGLAIAQQHGTRAGDTGSAMAVVALGRLGMAEMDLGSDADLVFIVAGPEVQASARPVAEKFLHVISGYTREGTLFPVDVRLRPRGSEGELVQTAESVLDYFSSSAEVWEAITYLKARPVVGDVAFGAAWCERLRDVLRQRFSSWEAIRAGLREMRRRLEEEAVKAGGDNFKVGPGGLYDLDFILSALALRAGARSQAGQPLTEQVKLLGPETELTAEEREQLAQAARFLRVLEHAVRLATGRSTPQLPAGLRLEMVAELASRWLGETFTGDSLGTRLAEVRQLLRTVFSRLFA